MRKQCSTSKLVGVSAVLTACCNAPQPRATSLPSSLNRSLVRELQSAKVTVTDSGVEFQSTIPLGGFETTTVLWTMIPVRSA